VSSYVPVVLLLAWSALAATALSGLVLAPLLGRPAAALALTPRHPTFAAALLLGLAGYPVAYALGFFALGEASLVTGTLLGIAHASLATILFLRAGGRDLVRDNATRLLLYVCYGALLGFAFLTP
jgi:hypothetical protein